eukprot:765116-Hanusia_phi.AAC.9
MQVTDMEEPGSTAQRRVQKVQKRRDALVEEVRAPPLLLSDPKPPANLTVCPRSCLQPPILSSSYAFA